MAKNGTLNWLVPTERMSFMDQQTFRKKAAIAGIEAAVNRAINGSDQSDIDAIKAGVACPHLDIREAQPTIDFGTAAAVDWWATQPLLVAGNPYGIFGPAIVAPALAVFRVAVFYRFGIAHVPPAISRLIFRNAGIVGNILSEFDLQQLWTMEVMEGYMSEPVVITPSQTFAAQVICSLVTGLAANVSVGCWIIEPTGTVAA